MRVFGMLLLALAIVGAPAAQASACRCAEVLSEDSAGCPCAGPDGECCGCCLPEPDEEHGTRLRERCPCDQVAPTTAERPAADLPAPALSAALADQSVITAASVAIVPAVERSDPHPEVRLPLLI